MALSSGIKKSNQSDSESDSDDEVRDELPFLRQENEQLGLLLDNRDDMLREAKKMRKELRASLEDARARVAELQTQNLDAKLETDSLKASPIVSDEVDCVDCSVFLVDLTVFKDKCASKYEELDVLRVEVDELMSRPTLLGACTSCPILHGKIDEMHAYTVSLDAKLKEHVPTSRSTCEVHALKNLELVHYVNRLQDENDELRKMMGWLSGHEPQLRMMMETYKHQDGKVLGSEKVGEISGEGGEKIGDIVAPPKTYHKNTFAPKPNPLRNKLNTNPDPPIVPRSTDDFEKPIKFKSTLGNVFFGKERERPSEAGLHRSDRCATRVKPVQVWADKVLVFVPVKSLVLVQEVVVMVVGLESLQVVSLLSVLPHVLSTGTGGVVALRWRGGTVHGLPFMVLVLLQLERVGSLVVVAMVVFMEVALIG
jgi:hypothetical protein